MKPAGSRAFLPLFRMDPRNDSKDAASPFSDGGTTTEATVPDPGGVGGRSANDATIVAALASPSVEAAAGIPGGSSDSEIATSDRGVRDRGLVQRILGWLFGPLEYPPAAADRIRELAGQGTLVYAARASSSLLGLYFNYALRRLGLPLARFVGGIRFWLWQPVDRPWGSRSERRRFLDRQWRERFTGGPPTASEALLAEMVARREPVFLVLRPESKRRAARRHDYLRALIAAQRRSAHPILLLPHVLVGRAQSGVVRGGIARRLFGSGRRDGRLRELVLLINAERASVRVGDPIDLRTFVTAAPEGDDAHLARRLSHELHRAISEEERVIAGPALPPIDATQRHVVRSPLVRAVVERLAREPGTSAAAIERRAERLFDEIAARYNVHYIRFLGLVMRWVFHRIYDGIVIDEPGLARVVEASRQGPLILCPSHKSHVDYLVLSYVLWDHGITPPHIAAGANLSFFPLGSIFRRAGAFFLRRTFKGDELYRAVFRAYISELVRTGTSIEFFLEGTRSRSGKLGMPKFGILSMVVDAWRQETRGDLQFVPVSIDYERIIEAGSYEHELLGGEKKSEDIGALLRTTRVLRSRYGRVHVQFGPPLSLADLVRQWGLAQSSLPELDPAWRRATERLGYRVLYHVAQTCTVTPTAVAATALLGHRGRGLPQGRFLAISESITDYLYTAAARLSAVLQSAATRQAAFLEAVQKLVDDGIVKIDRVGRSDTEPIYRVPEEQRIQLDFHKNAVMNYFAPAALVARAIVQRGTSTLAYTEVQVATQFLSRLFKREFLYRVDATYETHFDDALAALAVRGLLDVLDDGTVVVRDAETLGHIAGLLDAFVEAYWVTAQALTELRKFPLWDKELAVRARERARRAFLEGGIHRPEAASRTLIESALGWMLDTGVLEAKVDGRRSRLQLAAAYDGERLTALINQIGSYR